jgi:hypothetical protein
MPTKPVSPEDMDLTFSVYAETGNNISATARKLGLSRQTIQNRLRGGKGKKPLAGGQLTAKKVEKRKHPKKKNAVKRFIVTSAQNNTYVHDTCLKNLEAYAAYHDAEILVGTYTYNKNAYGQLAVKRGTLGAHQEKLWYDPKIMPYIEAADNRNIEVGPHLLWCGRANILPTDSDPLKGFEAYAGRLSGIFPHAKQIMVGVASHHQEATKFNYTTGTVTQQNYIQKKAGLKAEQHHTYGGLIVEVCGDGRWYVRQLVCDEQGVMYDLDVKIDNGKITTGNRVLGINWGDIHEATIQAEIRQLAFGKGGMLDHLNPKYQFFHDTLDWKARDLHAIWKNLPRDRFMNYIEGFDSVENELSSVANFLRDTARPETESVVVYSNHDSFFLRWLDCCDHRKDPPNAIYFLESSLHAYQHIKQHRRQANMVKWACLRAWGGEAEPNVTFLDEDASFIIAKEHNGGIECGMHGHDGANGARGNHKQFERMGRRTNTGHEHTSYLSQWGAAVAGLLGTEEQGYNHGPGSWSNTQIVTYSNGSRAAVTFWKGAYHA